MTSHIVAVDMNEVQSNNALDRPQRKTGRK
jgi:hypothetical protein